MADEDSEAAEQDESPSLGWRELYEDLQVHEYYPVDTFLVSVQYHITCKLSNA